MVDDNNVCNQVVAAIKENTGLDIQYDAGRVIIKQHVGSAVMECAFPARFIEEVAGDNPLGLQEINPTTILIAQEIPVQVRADLRRKKIGYLDVLGNAYLEAPPIFLMLEMQKVTKAEKLHAEKKLLPRPGIARAFNETGLRLLFALLNEPGLEKLPLRELAQKTGLALGTMHNIMAALKELKYLRIRGKNKVLTDKRDLLEKWANNFPDQLRPRILVGAYRPLQTAPEWWKAADINGLDACWGGEPGAELLTQYLQAERLTLYVFDTRADENIKKHPAIMRLRLIPDPNGTVEVLRAFWPKPEKEPVMPYAPPLVVYADLLATRDGRNREVAQRVYDDHLLQLVE